MANETKTHTLEVEPRELTRKANKQLRRQDILPGVVYGHNVEPANVQMSRREFENVYLRAGSTSLVDLKIGGDKSRKVFIHDVQRGATNHQLSHVDFMVVNLEEDITVSVPLVLTGESPLVESKEGMLIHQTEHLSVRALPMEIPPVIEVDISTLVELDQAIHVSDLDIPSNVQVLTPMDELIVKVTEMPMMHVEEEVEEAEEAEEAAEAAAEAEGAGEAEEGAETSEEEA
ncbi:MAG TPA: 50S ribosomal protein L25 [Chloroflexia bacterium]|nr:50S ribosomal protein L25 [Chloroflexia bacterium]